jgi:hypothetical protein
MFVELMFLRPQLLRFCWFSSVVLLVLSARPRQAHAQLRPLDPTDFRSLSGDRVRLQIGAGAYRDHPASLTGTQGQLFEAGDVRFSWRSGRILVEVAGTIQRFFQEDTVHEAPVEGVRQSAPDGKRHDSGDYRVQTVLRLSRDTAQTVAILRFGTRLPTTDNRIGLERDQTDFFASIGATRAIGTFHIAAEAGLSINGTRLLSYEQSDVFIYAASIERRGSVFSPFIYVVGQEDLHDWAVRGNEDLGEFRGGFRVGRRRWITVTMLRGFRDYSPSGGLTVTAGTSFR